jgi:hypothetical protein
MTSYYVSLKGWGHVTSGLRIEADTPEAAVREAYRRVGFEVKVTERESPNAWAHCVDCAPGEIHSTKSTHPFRAAKS